jgi:SPP1 gp7 family putative phage head morphogenesis protein
MLSKNYDISEIYVSEQLGIPLEYISKKENINIMNFSKDYADVVKKKINLNNKLLESTYNNIESVKKKVNNEISEAMSNAVQSVKSINDIKNVSVKLPDRLLQYMIISTLQWRIDIIEQNKLSTVKEYAEAVNMFDIPYDDAIKYVQGKYPILYDDLDEITEETTQKYFWVKESTSLELTKKIQKSLLTLLKNGGTFAEWKDNYENNFKTMGLEPTGSYTETIYRTNLQTAYAAGRYKQQESQKELFPYWQYVSIIDDVTTDICTELNGKTYRSNDPIWNTIYPPNHFNERSSVIALNNDDVAEMGINTDSSEDLKQTESYKNFKGSTFAGNPVKSIESDMQDSIDKKQEAVNINQKLLEEYIEVQ